MTTIGEAPPAPLDSADQVGGVRLNPVDECAMELHLRIARTFSHVSAPLDRHRLYAYWRSVLESAAQLCTVQANYALADVQDQPGMSAAKISALLAETESPLTKSGVEAAVRKARAARAEDEAEMEP